MAHVPLRVGQMSLRDAPDWSVSPAACASETGFVICLLLSSSVYDAPFAEISGLGVPELRERLSHSVVGKRIRELMDSTTQLIRPERH